MWDLKGKFMALIKAIEVLTWLYNLLQIYLISNSEYTLIL